MANRRGCGGWGSWIVTLSAWCFPDATCREVRLELLGPFGAEHLGQGITSVGRLILFDAVGHKVGIVDTSGTANVEQVEHVGCAEADVREEPGVLLEGVGKVASVTQCYAV